MSRGLLLVLVKPVTAWEHTRRITLSIESSFGRQAVVSTSPDCGPGRYCLTLTTWVSVNQIPALSSLLLCGRKEAPWPFVVAGKEVCVPLSHIMQPSSTNAPPTKQLSREHHRG